MKCRLDIRPEAETDLADAASWYQAERAELGAEFSAEMRQAIRSLADSALLYRVRARRRGREVRWLLQQRFPYRVIYYIEGQTVRIFAVLHAKRSDAAWKQRL